MVQWRLPKVSSVSNEHLIELRNVRMDVLESFKWYKKHKHQIFLVRRHIFWRWISDKESWLNELEDGK